MSKIIKQEIRRSMPLFVILCLLLSTTAIGLVFNFDIQLRQDKDEHLSLEITAPRVRADIATTTVRVLNAPPYITVDPAEDPGSTSTSPVNQGYSIDFNVTADDDENDDYYLLVCDSPGATAGAGGGAPSCNNTQFCVSEVAFTPGDTATCTYSNVDPTLGESVDWYAYVCDDHVTEAICTDTYSQGAAPDDYATSSPFYVNHYPQFTAISTTDDYKFPSSTSTNYFTVTASTTDTDTASSADIVTLHICQGSGFATTTGCTATTFCTGTSSWPSLNTSCQFASSTLPVPDGTWTYWAYVIDEHNLIATASPLTADYHVNNEAPFLGYNSVTLNGGADIYLNMRPNTTLVGASSTSVTDNNGCGDITSATGSIYYAASTTWNNYDCAADDDNCYQIPSSNCEIVSGTCGDAANDVTVTLNCTTTMAFHAIPTTNATNSPYANDFWVGAIKAIDDDGAFGIGTSSSNTVDVDLNLAIEVTQFEVPYGSIRSGQNSGTSTATTTIWNYGNIPMDSGTEGTHMYRDLGGAYIPVGQQKFATSSFYWTDVALDIYTLSATTTGASTTDIIAPKPTTAVTDIFDDLLWGIGVPLGQLSGNYTGTTTFIAILDSSDW